MKDFSAANHVLRMALRFIFILEVDPPIGSTAMEPARLCVCVNSFGVRTLCVGGTLLHFVRTGTLPGAGGALRLPEAVSAVNVRVDRVFQTCEGQLGSRVRGCRPLLRAVAPLLGVKQPALPTIQGNRVLRGSRASVSERVEGRSGLECAERASEALRGLLWHNGQCRSESTWHWS
jgi:hypothetical protein